MSTSVRLRDRFGPRRHGGEPRPGILLDRDGTIIVDDGYVGSVDRVRLIEGSAEAMPLDAHRFDTVLTSWTLCSIADARRALAEMRRVLKPGGRLLFVEHGMAPDRSVRWWQDILTPAWSRLSGGCHLNRPIHALVEDAGFRCERIDTGYMPGPRPMTFMYEGSARPE